MTSRWLYVVAILLVIFGLSLLYRTDNSNLPQVKVSPVAPVEASPQISSEHVGSARIPIQQRNPLEWIEQLPTKSQIQALSDAEVHQVPTLVVEAAEELTEYAEIVRNSPSLRPEALNFFKGCAEKDAVVDSLRAYCFSKAVTLQLELEGRVWDPVSVPATIKELATQL